VQTKAAQALADAAETECKQGPSTNLRNTGFWEIYSDARILLAFSVVFISAYILLFKQQL
jgi:hypothetical protein